MSSPTRSCDIRRRSTSFRWESSGLPWRRLYFPLLSRSSDDDATFVRTCVAACGFRFSSEPGEHRAVPGAVRHRSRRSWWWCKRISPRSCMDRAAAVLAGFAPAVWAYSLNHVHGYDKHDTRTPIHLAICMVGLNFTLNMTLIWPLREAGLAWSTATSAVVQCIALGMLCTWKLKVRPLDATTMGALVRIVVAGLLMGAAVFGIGRVWPAATAAWRWTPASACLVTSWLGAHGVHGELGFNDEAAGTQVAAAPGQEREGRLASAAEL